MVEKLEMNTFYIRNNKILDEAQVIELIEEKLGSVKSIDEDLELIEELGL